MKVLNFVRPENGLIHDPLYFLGFDKYEDTTIDCYLFMADLYDELYSNKYNDKTKIVLTLEEPNFCTNGQNGKHAKLDTHADKILTICPYTAELFPKREAVFFPFSEDQIPPETEKIWDIIYTGSMPRYIPWNRFLQTMYQFNHKDVYYNRGTDPNCTYQNKLKLYSQSKIAMVHCLCSCDNPAKYRAFPRASENKAFSHLDQGIMPQIKSRIFEAAFSKALILCWKDPWGILEKFFEPETDFIYFTDNTDLQIKIKDILKNYDKFLPMIESAYQKAIQNYTTKHFVESFIGLK